MATQIEIQNNIHLERLMSTNPKMTKEIQNILRKVIREAAKQVSLSASAAIPNDPRKAANAVRSTVYKAILGANVNLYNYRRAGKRASIPPAVRGRSRRTEDLMSYQGADRGFILRFLNSGTDMRTVEHINNHRIRLTQRPEGKRTYRGTEIGNRGRIAPRNWFGPATDRAMNAAIDQFNAMVEELITQELAAK